jgi:hypothetical protein
MDSEPSDSWVFLYNAYFVAEVEDTIPVVSRRIEDEVVSSLQVDFEGPSSGRDIKEFSKHFLASSHSRLW